MARPSKTRRVLKWGGTGVCVLLASAFLVSGWWHIGYSAYWGSDLVGAGLDGGFLKLYRWKGASYPQGYYVPLDLTGWEISPRVPGFDLRLVPYFANWPRPDFAGVPLSLPFVALLVPTLLVWRLDRRYPPGHCQKCGYDLTGNVSGICPECGTPTMQSTA